MRPVWEAWIRELLTRHRYKTLGALSGLVFALLVVWLGLLWALFIVLCTGAGYWVGKRLDEAPESVAEFLERFLPGSGGSRQG